MSVKRLYLIQAVLSLLFTAIVLGVSVFCYQKGLFKRLDNILYDLHMTWRGPLVTLNRQVLVYLDEKSAVDLSRQKGSWSRRQLAAALDNLCQAGAEVIAIDMLLSAPDADSAADRELAAAIGRCNNVVLARVSSAQGVEEITPLPLFQEAMIGDGFIDVPLDNDEVLRRIRFFNAKPLPDGELQLLPAMSLEVARLSLNIDYSFDFSDPKVFKMGAAGGLQLILPYPELLINYHGDHTVFLSLSYSDVVTNRFSPEIVKGRIVFLGSSLATQKDFFTTPFSRFASKGKRYAAQFKTLVEDVLGDKEPGVACHANAVETILSQRFIVRVPGGIVSSGIIFVGLLGLIFYAPRISTILEFFGAIAVVSLIMSTGYLLFVKKLLWLDTAPLMAVFVVQFVFGVALEKTFNMKRAALVTNLFGKYVAPSVVQELIKGNIADNFEGKRQELTLLFSDLRGFTTMSEELGARKTGILLNRYFDAMIPLVFENQGTLDKLMGDAIMAFYNAPLPVPDHPERAAATALAMIERLKALRDSGVEGMADIAIGIGINTGEVTVGNLGSREFVDYTAIGDAVNLASRLEGLNKVYGSSIILSEFTVDRLHQTFLVRDLDLVRVKGKETAVKIYELICFKKQASSEQLQGIRLFEEGLAFFRAMEWDRAEELFRQGLDLLPEDKPTLLYLERIASFRKEPPEPGWKGVTIFGHK